MTKIRWGIVGPGIIAQKFIEAVKRVDSAELVGVASRSVERAAAFAEKYGIPRAYSSYEEMAAAPEIDVVYISTAHPFHAPCAELFIKAKKHILCEKPLCVDSESAERLKVLAKDNGVFLMEGMWTAFLPAVIALQEEIKKGVIGEVKGLSADFCYSIEKEEDPKLFEKGLAGGSLLDVGVYCLHFASLILGQPECISAFSDIQNGVDYHTQMVLKYKNEAIATLSSAIKLEKPYDAHIYGTKGSIYVPNFYKADKYTVIYQEGETEEKQYPYGDNGFEFEIEEVCRCIKSGLLESPTVPLDSTINTLKQMDAVRQTIGLKFE
ncbi:MAG: Gfo/Idh/MocA family oxidoreductase [Clostridia bacterium]|nr:Gfo/Idh/MocA family oxidoreductase [Clostridia bacterium]